LKITYPATPLLYLKDHIVSHLAQKLRNSEKQYGVRILLGCAQAGSKLRPDCFTDAVAEYVAGEAQLAQGR
jgi:hypothetical protein